MSVSSKRILLLIVAGVPLLIGIGGLVLGQESVFEGSRIVLGAIVVAAGIFRVPLRRWMEAEPTRRNLRLLLQIMQVALGLAFIVAGAASLLALPPTSTLLLQLPLWMTAIIAGLIALVTSASSGRR